MYPSNEYWARTSMLHMNVELSHVELELSCVEFTLHGLLRRFSKDEISRHARKDLVRKSLDKLNNLRNFYSTLGAPSGGAGSTPLSQTSPNFDENAIQAAIISVAEYLQERRDHFYSPAGAPLDQRYMPTMERFFSPPLLHKVRTAEVSTPIPEPPFYPRARALGIPNLPSLTHMASVTFIDAIAFAAPITERHLFHALVHAAQFEILGLMRYTDLYVRSFLQVTRNFMVPLESQAFALDTRFAANLGESFDVEEEISTWGREGRYGVTSAPNPT